jgi:hypothetical protein
MTRELMEWKDSKEGLEGWKDGRMEAIHPFRQLLFEYR